MQMTIDHAPRPAFLALAMKRSKGYVMRSEKRPGYGGASGGNGRKPKKRKAGLFYIIMTIIISVILWPIGMVMLWRKKVRMQAGTKLLISLLTMCMCIFLIVFALTVHVDNEQYTQFQDRANDWLNDATAKLAVAGDAAYQQGVETWGVMSDFANNAIEPVANTAADGLDRAVLLACQARSKVQGVPLEDILPARLNLLVPKTPAPTEEPETPEATVEPEETGVSVSIPENTPDPAGARPLEAGLLTSDGEIRPGETPAPTPTPEPTPTPTVSPEPTEAPLAWSTVDDSIQPETTDGNEETPLAAAEVEPVGDAGTVEPTESAAAATLAPVAESVPQPAAEAAVEATAEAAAEPTPVPEMTVLRKLPGEARVYYNATGRLYHMQSTCEQMSGAAPHTLSEAIVAGKQHCDACGTPDESIIREPYTAWLDTNGVFHTSDTCAKFEGEWKLISLNDAIAGDYTACPDCEANIYAALYGDVAAATAVARAAETPTEEPTVEPTETPEPTATPTPAPETVTPLVALKPAGDATVYHSSNGKFYHRFQICKGMTGSSPYKLSEIGTNYRRCRTCDAPDIEMVGKTCLWIDENQLCHTSDECEKFSGDYNFILRDDALDQGLTGCPACGADEYLKPGTVLAADVQ